MKKIIDGILVVEGKSDVAYLSNYFEAEFVITNGSEISKDTIDYLKHSNKQIIVLTDPDSPGKRIRDVLDQNIPNLKHCFIEKKYAVKHGKVGVAECDIDEIVRALEHSFTPQKDFIETISMSDLYELGLIGEKDSSNKREKVSKFYNLGFSNAKTFYKRLNSLKITKKDLEALLDE